MEGRHVHPSTLYPGGCRHRADRAAVHRLFDAADALLRIHEKCVPLHDDLFDFFYDALQAMKR